MSTLRREYNKSKAYKEKIVSEAALHWVAKNVVLINEKIDRTTISRLIDSIQKFEDTFGKYADRLPAIGQYLNTAEQGLQQVITGKANDRKASAMLKKLTILYFTFSDFFTRDLPVLLRARIFDAAKEQPDVRLDMIRNRNGTSYNPYLIRDALANALIPTKEEKKLLSKIYRSSLLPKLNAEEIANQLTTLSFNELEELTKIGKVPMVATPEEIPGEETPIEENPPTSLGVPPTTPPVPEHRQKNGDFLGEENLYRQNLQLLTEGKIEDLQAAVANVKKIVSSIPEINSKLGAQVNKMQSDLLTTMNSEAWGSWLQKVKQGFQQGATPGEVPEKGYARAARGATGALKQALTAQLNPQERAISDLLAKVNTTIQTFKAVAGAWPNVGRVIADKESLTGQDISNIENILMTAAAKPQPGVFGKWFGGKKESFIPPEKIVEAFMSIVKE